MFSRGLQKICLVVIMKSLVVFFVLNFILIFGQAGSLDPTFKAGGYGINGAIYVTKTQSDGKVIVAGGFDQYNNIKRNQIIRVNTDGSLDTSVTFGSGTNDVINSLEIYQDGKILIGGYFTTYNEFSRNGIARLNVDGSLDTSFDPGQGADGSVSSMVIQSDGKIIIGGSFTTYNGVSRNRIARLNMDGSLDTSFNIGTGFDSTVNAISFQSDGKVLVGGAFSNYNGVSRNHITRINSDGSLDTTFNPGTGFTPGFNVSLKTITLQPDGKILVGGNFSSYNGVSRDVIARINSDGSLDTAFSGTGINGGYVYSMIRQTDGKILIGGILISYNGISVNNIARINSNGSLDTAFNVGTGANSAVYSINAQSTGKIIIAGVFTKYNDISVPRFARLNSDGSLDNTFGIKSGANSSVNTSLLQEDGKIVLSGAFTSYNSIPQNRINRINKEGTLDDQFNIGTGANNNIYASTLQKNGKILLGGDFTSFNTKSKNRLVRLNVDGSVDETLNVGSGLDNRVSAIALQTDGKVILGGSFTSYNGTARNRIVRINEDGSLDSGFNVSQGFNGTVAVIMTQTNGKIIIGGDFTTYNGVSRNRIARLNTDGSLDTSFNIGIGANGFVKTIEPQPDGKLLIGGDFTDYNGIKVNRIARLNTDGSLDSSFNPGTGFNDLVMSIKLQTDGKIIVGGNFTSYNSTTANRLVRLQGNGFIDTSLAMGEGFNSYVETIQIEEDGNLFLGGSFTQFNGSNENYITRLSTDGTISNTLLREIDTGSNNTIAATAVQPDGKIIIGGGFTEYNGENRNRIARLNADGSLDPTFNTGEGIANSISSVALQSDGKILIGGSIFKFGGVFRYGIARLNPDGSLDNTFKLGQIGDSNRVNAIKIQKDGKILIGGSIYDYNIRSYISMLRLNSDGSIDTSFNSSLGMSSVYSITEHEEKILVAGYNNVGGVYKVYRLNIDGSIDTTFVESFGANSMIRSMTIQSEGKILIGGDFTSYNGVSRNRIARLNSNGSLDITFNPGSGTDGSVYAVLPQSEGKTLIAGRFKSYNGVFQGRISRLNSDGSLDTSFNSGSGASSTSYASYGFALFILSLEDYIPGKVIIAGFFGTYNNKSIFNIARINTKNCSSPPAPTGSSTQNVLLDSRIGDIQATGTNIQWYTASTGGSILPSTTLLENGKTYYATQTSAEGCESVERLAVTVSTSLGVKENNMLNLKYYPNPIEKDLFISSDENIYKIIIIDIGGNIVFTRNFNQKELSLDLSRLSSGLYIVKIQGSNQKKEIKIIKK